MGKFDEYVAAALEYDIFAGGDPNRPRSERYVNDTAAANDAVAKAEKDEADRGGAIPVAPGNEPANETPENQSGPEENSSEEMGESSADISDTSEMPDSGNTGDGSEGDMTDDMSGQGDSDVGPSTAPISPVDQKRKEGLFNIAVSLYEAIQSNLSMMNKADPPLDEEANKNFFNIRNQLMHCADLLYNIITREIKSGDYIDILRKFTSINVIYDLCITSLDLLYPDNKDN